MPPKDKKPAPLEGKRPSSPPTKVDGKRGNKKMDVGAGGEQVTVDMKILAALKSAATSKLLDLCNLGLNGIPQEVWKYCIEADEPEPLIPVVKQLQLSSNKLTDFEGWDRLAHITDLSLDRCNLIESLPDSICALTNLTRLNISSNKLRNLKQIAACQRLVDLNASDNELQSLPPSIGTLTELKTLEVSFNQLVTLPDEVSACAALVSIRARGNELKTLPLTISKLWTLEVLMIDKNPLIRLPYCVASMPLRQITYDIELLQSPPLAIAAQGPEYTMHYLKLLRAAETRGKLEIENMKLDMVPIEVCELHALTILSMKHNQIKSLPRSLTDLSKLMTLDVSHNQIEEIQLFLTQLQCLCSFDISYNLITTVPRGIGYCAMLGSLNLEGNHVFSPPPMILRMGTPAVMMYLKQLCDADKIGVIDLHGLELPVLPQEVSELSLVQQVDVSQNLLTSIRPLQMLTLLTKLNVSSNRLRELDDDLKDLVRLKALDVSHNSIKAFSSAIRCMTGLTALDLSHNPLQELPQGLWSLTALGELRVEGCDIRFPPQDVVAKGVKSLLNFQRMIERGRYTRRLDLSGIGFHDLTVPDDMWAPLNVLNIDRNYIATLPGQLKMCTALTELRTANNQLLRLPDAIGELVTISLLDVRNNVLQSLPDSVILLYNCQCLRVSGNRLSKLPEPLNGLTALTNLEADENALIEIPGSLCDLPGLKMARFSRNRIAQVPLAIGKLTALQVLTLTSNMLERMPLNVRLLTNLIEFDATDNPDIDLPPKTVVEQGAGATRNFLTMVHATLRSSHLDVSGFNLTQTPKFLAGMTGLTGLNLKDNRLDELYTVIPLVKTLTNLNALGNKIKYMPIEIGGRTSLKELQVDQEIWDTCASELQLSASRHVRDYLRRLLEGQESTSLMLDSMGLQVLPVMYAERNIWHSLAHLEYLSVENNQLCEIEMLADLTLLKTLDLSGNQLQTLPDSFAGLTALTKVSLKKNNLSAIPACTQKWAKLMDLIIADNGIVGLPVAIFEALKELCTLDCKNNKIQEVKGPIWMLPRLRILDVQGNDIMSPPMAFVNKGKRSVMAYFKSLDTAQRTKSVNLKQSDLTSIPSAVLAIRTLTSLVVEENYLVTLPPDIEHLKDLVTLSVKSNKLKNLPDTLSGLVNLKELDLSDNQLEELPIASMALMVRLSLLNLENNLLVTAPFELFQTTTLKKLKLSGNNHMKSPPQHLINDESKNDAVVAFLRLEAQALTSGKVRLIKQECTSFPIEVLRLRVVTEMILSQNRLRTISDHVQHLTCMQKLFLDQNLIESLPDALGACVNLLELRLNSNELTTFPQGLSRLCNLTFLDISKNQFQILPSVMQTCTRLITLSAKDNLLTEIPPWISCLSNLRDLRLARNSEISSLPFQIADLKKLHELDLEENDVGFPPPAIFDAGLDSVKSYLSRLQHAPQEKLVDLSGVMMATFSCHPYIASFALKKMILKQCGLKEVNPNISRLSSLEELDISHNLLRHVPVSIGELKVLQYLNIENNQIKELERSLGQCMNLRTLIVANNQLTFLPTSLGFATNLKTLSVSGNAFTSPPDVYLRKRSLPWTLQYLRARHEGNITGNLQITSMSLSDIPSDVLDLGNLLKLNLNCNDLRDIPKDILRMTGLQNLSMTNNKLMRVPEAVCEMTWLQSLLLEDNMIKDLPVSINSLNSLRSLSLAHNSLSSLPVKLNGLSQLVRLSLDGNAIGDVPRAIMQLTEIRILSMRNCGVAVLPEGITNLVKLQELQMNDNILEVLPDLSACQHMRIMRLSNNRLMHLPISLVELVELRELSLLGNMVQRLPDDFTRLTNLELLQLDGQNFDSIPADITEQGGKRILEYIRKMALADTTATLDLSGMRVQQLPAAVCMIKSLQHLFLHNNPIAKLPPMIVQLTNLKTLTLNGTRVRSLPILFPEIYQLKKLDMDVELMVFPPQEICELGLNAIFSYLRKILNGAILGSLDLSNSGMKEIPADLAYSTGIKTLDLSNNRIVRVPCELCLLTALTSLNLDMNPLRPHVQDVVSRGLEALMKYLRSLYSGAQTGKLDLVQQELRFYPDEIDPEWHITWLRLDDNKIRHLPRKMGHLTGLTVISVVGNQLADLPDTLTSLTNLTSLLIDSNELQELPFCVVHMKNLVELSVTNNQLSSLPAEGIGRLNKLTKIRVQGNPKLTHLPLTIGSMKNLRHIEFDPATVVSPDPQFQSDHATVTAYLQTLSDSMRTQSLDLSSRELTAFPMDVLLLTGLTYMTIARNKIRTLPDEMCHHLSNLRMLDIEANKIEALPASVGYARHLTCICALGNSISSVPSSLGLVHDHGMLLEIDPDKIKKPPPEIFSRGTSQALSYLRLLQDSMHSCMLSLSKWRLSALPIEITDIESLTELSISFNNMKELPPEIEKLSKLTRLKASHNNLVALPPELAFLTRLTDLDVTSNPLDSGFPSHDMVDRGVMALQALFREVMAAKKTHILELGHLAIDSIRLEGSTLTGLRRLSLDRGSPVLLENFTFSATTKQLETLTEISMCDVGMNALPGFVLECNMIKSLNLSNNRFTVFPERICQCLPLTHLRLNFNNISEIPDSISLLTDLRVLAVSFNQLSQLNEVIAECCHGLEELYVSNNRIQVMPANLSLRHRTMRILDLEHNLLTKLPPAALKLTQLTSLKMAGNSLDELPLELGQLLYLQEITVPSSDLGNVPRDVVQAGGKAIIRYVCGIHDCEGSGLLDLSGMNLSVLPPSIRVLTSSLTYLKLDSNPLKRLPNWLGEMQLLSRLSLRDTLIQRVPATLGAIAALEDVALDEESSTLLSPPQEVVAKGNPAIVPYLRRSYAAVIHRQLDLSGFGLKKFPFLALSTPTTLTSLALNDNELEEMPDELATITGLVMLSLSNNRIAKLPAHIFKAFPLLKSLNIGGNPISGLPLTLGALSRLDFLEFDATDRVRSPPRDITIKSIVAVVTYLKRAWAGRQNGMLNLSGMDLTDVPSEITTWAPCFSASKQQLAAVAEEEGAEQVRAVETRDATAATSSRTRDATAATSSRIDRIDGAIKNVAGGEEDQDVSADKDDCEDLIRDAAYAVTDEAGREEQKEDLVVAMLAAPDILSGEHAPVNDERYNNQEDDDRDFGHEEDIPATQLLAHTVRGEQAKDSEDAESLEQQEVDSLVSSEDEIGSWYDDDDDEEDKPVPLPPEESITGYKALVSLDLRENSISMLRDEVGLMHSLRSVQLCHNCIKVLPEALALLPHLKTLVATHNQIKVLPEDFGELKKSLKLLDLQHNELEVFTGALEHLSALEELNINNNSIPKIEIESDGALPALKYLYVNNNLLKKLDVGGKTCLVNLRVFTAVRNEIAEWPELTGSRRLRELQLANNCLRGIGASVASMRLLKTLDLSNNLLKDVPAQLSEAVRLRELILFGNPLQDAPVCALHADTGPLFKFLADLGSASKTGRALFAGHKLGSIPLQILQTQNVVELTHVDFSDNDLATVPRQISLLTQLKVLSLRDNLLSSVPIEISACPVLHTLNLDRNRFQDIVPNICEISQLEVLTISENKIVMLPYNLCNMVSLVMLDLRGNPNLSKVSEQLLHENLARLMIYIRDIQQGLVYDSIALSRRGLLDFPIEVQHGNGTLKSLCIAYNEITELPMSLGEMTRLTHLDVSNNQIQRLPEVFDMMTELTTLLCNDNQLMSLPATFVHLSALTSLALERNPLSTFPFDLVENWTGLTHLTIDTEQPVVMPLGAVHTSTELMPLEVISQGMSKCVQYQQRMKESRATGTLDMSVMQLSFLPHSILRMPLLTMLNLTGNSLLIIPESITSLYSLTDLGLNDNRLSTLPPPMAALSKLQILSVMDNRLTHLSPEIGKLTSLINLNLTNNPDLTCPPPEVFKRGLPNILAFLNKIACGKTMGSIELAGLSIEILSLPWIDLQLKLQALVLSRNQLASLPTALDHCTSLTALWADSNSLTTLPASLGKLANLKSLALDMNLMAALPSCVCDLTALERLTLDNNVLRFLHPRMSELQSLTLLSAANNRLTILPASLATISCLRSLTLAGNPLAPLPPALRDRHDIDMDVAKT